MTSCLTALRLPRVLGVFAGFFWAGVLVLLPGQDKEKSIVNSLFATYKSPVCHIILGRAGIGAPFWKYYFQLAVSFNL